MDAQQAQGGPPTVDGRKMFEFNDGGARFWIVAENEQAARDLFLEECNDEPAADLKVRELLAAFDNFVENFTGPACLANTEDGL